MLEQEEKVFFASVFIAKKKKKKKVWHCDNLSFQETCKRRTLPLKDLRKDFWQINKITSKRLSAVDSTHCRSLREFKHEIVTSVMQ